MQILRVTKKIEKIINNNIWPHSFKYLLLNLGVDNELAARFDSAELVSEHGTGLVKQTGKNALLVRARLISSR